MTIALGREAKEDMVKLLLVYNADLSTASARSMQTALHVACMDQDVDMAELLILHGARLDCRDFQGRRPTDYLADEEITATRLLQARERWLTWSRRANWLYFLIRTGLWRLGGKSSSTVSHSNACHASITKCLQTVELAVLICQFQ